MRKASTVGLDAAAPLLRYRCSDCGYGASRRQPPERCPMCGGITWQDEGWKPFGDVAADLVAAARRAAVLAGADADAPLIRELQEVSVFPGVPLS
jgi:hypothetical protein